MSGVFSSFRFTILVYKPIAFLVALYKSICPTPPARLLVKYKVSPSFEKQACDSQYLVLIPAPSATEGVQLLST